MIDRFDPFDPGWPVEHPYQLFDCPMHPFHGHLDFSDDPVTTEPLVSDGLGDAGLPFEAMSGLPGPASVLTDALEPEIHFGPMAGPDDEMGISGACS